MRSRKLAEIPVTRATADFPRKTTHTATVAFAFAFRRRSSLEGFTTSGYTWHSITAKASSFSYGQGLAAVLVLRLRLSALGSAAVGSAVPATLHVHTIRQLYCMLNTQRRPWELLLGLLGVTLGVGRRPIGEAANFPHLDLSSRTFTLPSWHLYTYATHYHGYGSFLLGRLGFGRRLIGVAADFLHSDLSPRSLPIIKFGILTRAQHTTMPLGSICSGIEMLAVVLLTRLLTFYSQIHPQDTSRPRTPA
ncbi:hypothetical protein BDV95DRAFT_218507 [Massariosphaeria phaeospora]|uniref:Uncharacterized protein n=1 Tax=Massariosphaeria phaeospora TaxID=100035 RepID=A0A7C8MF85_9PLEO|nr:hypothetical protein BDV95DRAFT_218507 [Massariosphaeria phaeospora]